MTTWCNTPQYVDCGPRECQDNSCISDVVTEEPLNYECEHDGYFAYPEDCSRFIVCAGGDATEKTCPVGEDGVQWMYREEEAWCDLPQNVDCGSRPVCDQETGENNGFLPYKFLFYALSSVLFNRKTKALDFFPQQIYSQNVIL